MWFRRPAGAVILSVSGAGQPVRCKRVLDSCHTLTEAPLGSDTSPPGPRASPVRTQRFLSATIRKTAVRSRMVPAEAALLGALVIPATMWEMRSTGSLAPLALANSTLPQQQELDAGRL